MDENMGILDLGTIVSGMHNGRTTTSGWDEGNTVAVVCTPGDQNWNLEIVTEN